MNWARREQLLWLIHPMAMPHWFGGIFLAKGNNEIPVPALFLPCSFWHQLCLPAAGEQGKQPMLERWLQNKWGKKAMLLGGKTGRMPHQKYSSNPSVLIQKKQKNKTRFLKLLHLTMHIIFQGSGTYVTKTNAVLNEQWTKNSYLSHGYSAARVWKVVFYFI